MKRSILKSIVLLSVFTLAISCNSKNEEQEKPAPIDKEQIKNEIQAKENQFAEIYNSGVVTEIGYYADDAITFYQNRKPLIGKSSIVEFLKSDLVSNTTKISFITNEVFVSNDGDHVVEIGSYKVVDSTNTPINTGNYMSLFEKRDGSYYCIRDMSASDMPLE